MSVKEIVEHLVWALENPEETTPEYLHNVAWDLVEATKSEKE